MGEDWEGELERRLAPYLEGLGNKTRRRTCPAYIAGLWDGARLEAILRKQADALVGGDEAWLIVDDTALPKKGKASVGVAPQYATVLGKNASCQTLVSVSLASGEVPLMLSLRLFLPES